jgi:hypothetical protein
MNYPSSQNNLSQPFSPNGTQNYPPHGGNQMNYPSSQNNVPQPFSPNGTQNYPPQGGNQMNYPSSQNNVPQPFSPNGTQNYNPVLVMQGGNQMIFPSSQNSLSQPSTPNGNQNFNPGMVAHGGNQMNYPQSQNNLPFSPNGTQNYNSVLVAHGGNQMIFPSPQNGLSQPFTPNGNQNYNPGMVAHGGNHMNYHPSQISFSQPVSLIAHAGNQNLQLVSPVIEQSRTEILQHLELIKSVTFHSIKGGGKGEDRRGVFDTTCAAIQMISTNANAIVARYEEEIGSLRRELESGKHLLTKELQDKDLQINSLKEEAASEKHSTQLLTKELQDKDRQINCLKEEAASEKHDTQLLTKELQDKDRQIYSLKEEAVSEKHDKQLLIKELQDKHHQINSLKEDAVSEKHDNHLLLKELQVREHQISSLKEEAVSPEKIKEIGRMVVEETLRLAGGKDEKLTDDDSMTNYSDADDESFVGDMEALHFSPPQTLFNMNMELVTGTPVNVEPANLLLPSPLPGKEEESSDASIGAMTKIKAGFVSECLSFLARPKFKLVNKSGKNVVFDVRSRTSLVTGFVFGSNKVGVTLDRTQKSIECNTLEAGKDKIISLESSRCQISLCEPLADGKFRVFVAGKKISNGQKYTFMEHGINIFVTVDNFTELELLLNRSY